MSTAFGYTRYSTKHQDDSRLVAAHGDQMVAYYEYKLKPDGVHYAGLFVDQAVSGAKPFSSRKVGAEIESRMKPGDHIITVDLDRCFRSAIDCLQTTRNWDARGIVTHILKISLDTSSSIGRCIMGVMACLAELERERISERCSETARWMISRGLKQSWVCGLGYEWLGTGHKAFLEKDKKVPRGCVHPAFEILQTILRLRDSGMTVSEISRSLSSNGDVLSINRVKQTIRFHTNVAMVRHAIGVSSLPAMPLLDRPVRIAKPPRGAVVTLLRQIERPGRLYQPGTKFRVGGGFGGKYDLVEIGRNPRTIPAVPFDWFEYKV